MTSSSATCETSLQLQYDIEFPIEFPIGPNDDLVGFFCVDFVSIVDVEYLATVEGLKWTLLSNSHRVHILASDRRVSCRCSNERQKN